MRARIATSVAIIALAAGLLGGCAKADTAAVVNGVTISESKAQATARQLAQELNLQNPPTTGDIVQMMILVPTFVEVAAEKGVHYSAEAARSDPIFSTIDPTDYAVELLRVQKIAEQLPQDAQAEFAARVAELDVEVNPRYGTFDPTTMNLTPGQPDWIAAAED